MLTLKKYTFAELVELMARLRGPAGCPWDREQDHRSLRTYMLEETYEVLDAIEADDPRALRDELGDLLLQVVFHAQMAREAGRFTIEEVISSLCDKLIRRHPHVFADARVKDAEQVVANWEALKAAERASHEQRAPAGSSILLGVPHTLPGTLQAYQLTRRAAKVGFDWAQLDDVLKKLQEEVAELRQAAAGGERAPVEGEVGDLLFVVVNVARKLGVDPEVALQAANRKFIERFTGIELELARQGRRLEEASLEEMDALWERSKGKRPPE